MQVFLDVLGQGNFPIRSIVHALVITMVWGLKINNFWLIYQKVSENFLTRQFHYWYSVKLSGEQLENPEIKKPLKFNTETLELDNPKIRKSWN